MSKFTLPSIPDTPSPFSDFDIATYLEAQRTGFSSSPPPPATSNTLGHNRNDSGASILQPLPGSQEATSQSKVGNAKEKEPYKQQEASSSTPVTASTPAPRGPRSIKDVTSQSKFKQEQSKGDSSQHGPASSSHSSSPKMFFETSPSMGTMSGRPAPTEQSSNQPATTTPATAPLIPEIPNISHRRSPCRTFSAPTVTWSTYRALSPLSINSHLDSASQNTSSSSSSDALPLPFPTFLPSPSPSTTALSTAHHIHLRPISGSSEVSQISLPPTPFPPDHQINDLPPLTRCPPRHPRIRSVTSYSAQRYDLTAPAPLFAGLDASGNSSSTSLGTRTEGSRFVEHVGADGEGMYNSAMGVVGSRSSVALGVWGVGRGEDRDEDEVGGEEKGGKGKGKKKRKWRRVFCFH